MKALYLIATFLWVGTALAQLPHKPDTGNTPAPPTFRFTDTTFVKGSEKDLPYMKFQPASTVLTLGGQYYADSLVYFMQHNPTASLRIEYTQHEWPAAMEESYSKQRAHSVKEYLVEKGIDKKRVNEKTTTTRVNKPLNQINAGNYSVKVVVY